MPMAMPMHTAPTAGSTQPRSTPNYGRPIATELRTYVYEA